MRHALFGATLAATAPMACSRSAGDVPARDQARIVAAVQAAVWSFHAADTARDAEAVIRLLWPEFTILADGTRLDYDQVATGSREFMGGLALFHTVWSDLRVTPIGQHAAVASFQFRDSIVTRTGELTRNRGTTTFVWQRRNGEWRLLFADADHRPVVP
jgi:hypothetical protein